MKYLVPVHTYLDQFMIVTLDGGLCVQSEPLVPDLSHRRKPTFKQRYKVKQCECTVSISLICQSNKVNFVGRIQFTATTTMGKFDISAAHNHVYTFIPRLD